MHATCIIETLSKLSALYWVGQQPCDHVGINSSSIYDNRKKKKTFKVYILVKIVKETDASFQQHALTKVEDTIQSSSKGHSGTGE